MIPSSIQKAKAAHREAANALTQAVKEAYPIDSLVSVRMGKARVIGKIIAHPYGGRYPDEVRFENTVTKARRYFNASEDRFDVKAL